MMAPISSGCSPRASLTLVIGLLLVLHAAPSQAQYRNVRVSSPSSTDPEEVSIAINPVYPWNLAAGANIHYAYYSLDGGLSWTQQNLVSPSFGVWGDPCLVYDADGSLYYGHLSNPPSGGYWIDRIVVQTSTTQGVTWDGGVGIGYHPPRRQQDKEWLAADLTGSPFRNYLYIAWTEFDSYGSSLPSDSSRILFSRSTDHGQSWSAPVRVNDVSGNCLDEDSTVEGAVPAVGPNGEVYLSWGGPLGIMFDKSTDAGATWGRDSFVTSQPGGWDFGITGIYRANGMPITACDISNSPYRGNIYINWSDQRNGPGNTDIFFIRSTDGGQTWGPVVRVNDDLTVRQQFFSWMTVDQTTGYIYIVFYDRRNTTGDWTDVFVAKSTDGGQTFANMRVSDTAFDPHSAVFFGDYTNITARNGIAYPIWMRLDTGGLSVWTAIVTEPKILSTPVTGGWNMLSVSLKVRDWRKGVLLPAAAGGPYWYSSGYQLADTLRQGRGYWVKFPAAGTFTVTGDSVGCDTFAVSAGWNMIGAISSPVAVAAITSDPPGAAVSQFLAFDGSGYVPSDTLQPGLAYWVKAGEAATLVLGTPPPAGAQPEAGRPVAAGRIRIIPSPDMPPPPPGLSAGAFVPEEFALSQNYPNPFNPGTTIEYSLPSAGHVTLRVLSPLGDEVRLLVDRVQGAGFRSVSFDGHDLPSGVYFYQLRTQSFTAIRKMVLIK